MRIALVAALLAACSQPAPAPTTPPVVAAPPVTAPPVPIDAPAPSQEEKLAAIQKGMNELDEAAQSCWALAATDRFDIEGEVAVMIEIGGTGTGTATIVKDTARNTKLSTCLVKLLGGYRWAPPLYGDTIQLPFAFKAPDGQSVIDRALVEWHGQSNVSIAVVLDENNTGNDAASILDVAIAPRSTTGLRIAERTELWYLHGEIELETAKKTSATQLVTTSQRVPAGAMVFVPRGAARALVATRPDVRATLVLVPGGREGTARAGALPTPTVGNGAGQVSVLARGTPYGPATIFLEPAVIKGTPLAASIVELPAGTKLAEHVHAGETELVYVLEGSGTMVLAGQTVAVTPTSVIQIPPNTKHAFTATTAVRALQLFTPPGPEQRFKKKS